MTRLALLPALVGLFCSAQEAPRVTSITLKASFEIDLAVLRTTIGEACPGTSTYWWIKGATSELHVVGSCESGIRLKAVRQALESYAGTVREAIKQDVSLSIDESTLLLEGTVRVWGRGPIESEALSRVLQAVPDSSVAESKIAGIDWSATLKATKPVALAKVRSVIEAANLGLVDVELTPIKDPVVKYECPEKCSRSFEAGLCPECLSKLAEAVQPEKPSG